MKTINFKFRGLLLKFKNIILNKMGLLNYHDF